MTMFEMKDFVPVDKLNEKAWKEEVPRNCLLTTGEVAEKCAELFNYTREQQDRFGYESHKKAKGAQKMGRLSQEIICIETEVKDPKTGEVIRYDVHDEDDGIRVSTMEKLATLKTPFKENGTVTAGSASQLTDGAAIAFLARRS